MIKYAAVGAAVMTSIVSVLLGQDLPRSTPTPTPTTVITVPHAKTQGLQIAREKADEPATMPAETVITATTQPASTQDPRAAKLQQMLKQRQAVPVTTPTFSAMPPKKRPALRPGQELESQRCTLMTMDQVEWKVLKFTSPDLDPMLVLPNRLLEELEKVCENQPTCSYRVSGLAFNYKNQGYLLLTGVSIETPEQATKPAKGYLKGEKNTAWPTADGQKPAAAGSGAASATTQPAVQKPASPEEIMAQMMEDKPAAALQMPVAAPVQETAGAIAGTVHQTDLPAEPSLMVIDRVVRVSRQTGTEWWQAKFLGDNTLSEPPIRLLPCEMLERAQRMGGNLRVSGQIMEYHGKRYLLLGKVLEQKNTGEF